MSSHDLVSAPAKSNLNAALFGRSGQTMLHIGCGYSDKNWAGPGFLSDEWKEIRLDIDPAVSPDIVGSILDMSAIPAESVDAVFSSHTLEHLYAHEIPVALQEMRRVLKPNGFMLSTVPDLQSAARMIAEDRLFDTAYDSPAGPIAPFDILYSLRSFVGRERPFMAHHSGFTLSTLMATVKAGKFASVVGIRREAAFDLWVLGTVAPTPEDAIKHLASKFFPA